MSTFYFKSEKQSKYIIIYCYGNNRNVSEITKFIYFLTVQGFDVVAFDYHGGGKSEDCF